MPKGGHEPPTHQHDGRDGENEQLMAADGGEKKPGGYHAETHGEHPLGCFVQLVDRSSVGLAVTDDENQHADQEQHNTEATAQLAGIVKDAIGVIPLGHAQHARHLPLGTVAGLPGKFIPIRLPCMPRLAKLRAKALTANIRVLGMGIKLLMTFDTLLKHGNVVP